jgi:large subunit ribosomal protein L18
MARTNRKTIAREKRIKRIRKKISGTAERPRLRVFKSSKHIYAQVINDVEGKTICSMSTLDKFYIANEANGKIAVAHNVGLLLAKKAIEKGINKVVFDRGGYIYHGRIKALSEGVREGGLEL